MAKPGPNVHKDIANLSAGVTTFAATAVEAMRTYWADDQLTQDVERKGAHLVKALEALA